MYIFDNILTASTSIDEHLEHVEKVLQQLKQAGLQLKPSKCTFATTEIQYLGHTLTLMGAKPNDSKVMTVKDFPRPQTVKQVKSFLGLANFYRRHIPRMAVISRPLTDLTRKSCTEFVWTPGCEEAFEEIKRLLVTQHLYYTRTTNQAADALSRAPLSSGKVMHIEMEAMGLLTSKIQASQRKNKDLL